jgi:hypothetical protein
MHASKFTPLCLRDGFKQAALKFCQLVILHCLLLKCSQPPQESSRQVVID